MLIGEHSGSMRFLHRMTHTAMRDTRAGFDIAEQPRRRRASPRRWLGRASESVRRSASFHRQFGRTVVGQALEIGPDQGVFRRREGAALAVIELTGQEHEQLPIATLFHLANGRPESTLTRGNGEGHSASLVVTSQLATSCGDSARALAGASGLTDRATRRSSAVQCRSALAPPAGVAAGRCSPRARASWQRVIE